MAQNEGGLALVISSGAIDAQVADRLRGVKVSVHRRAGDRAVLRILPNGMPSELLDDLREENYRVVRRTDRDDFSIAGGLRDGWFDSDLCALGGIEMQRELEPEFLAFLEANPFECFGRMCRRRARGERIVFLAAARLGSPEYRDIRHELPTFILRSGERAFQMARCAVYNEDAGLQRFGELSPLHRLSAAIITFKDAAARSRLAVRRNGTLREFGSDTEV